MGCYNILLSVTHLSLLLFQDGQVETVLLGKSDEGFLATTDDENVGLSGGEALSVSILHMNDIVSSQMFLDMDDLTDSADIVSTSNITGVSELILDPFLDLASGNLVLDSISSLNLGVRESNGPCIVGNNVRDLVWSNSSVLDFQQFKLLSLKYSEKYRYI